MIKRSVVIAGHATSVSLEPEFWEALHEIAKEKGQSVTALICEVDRNHTLSEGRNLSSSIRVYILKHLQRPIS